MRKRTNFFVWVVGVLILFLIIGFFTPFSSTLKSAFYNLTFPVQRTMLLAGNTFFKDLEILRNTEGIREEVELLRKENRKMSAEIARTFELEKENEALRQAMNLDIAKEEDFVLGEVFGRDLTAHRLLVRHNGEVRADEMVITPEGVLVGRVEEVMENYAYIKLLTSSEESLEVRVQNEEEPAGVLQGKGGEVLHLGFLPKGKRVNVGERVVSLPQEGSLSKGIFIGEIHRVKDDDMEKFITAKVRQGFDARYLDYLMIIKE